MGNLGPWEIALIVGAILLLFGSKAVPKIGRSAGKTVREFKESVGDVPKEMKEALETPSELRNLNPKKTIKDALNPFRAEDEQELREALTDAEIHEALSRRSEVQPRIVPDEGPAASAEQIVELDAIEPVDEADATEKVVEAEPAKPIEH